MRERLFLFSEVPSTIHQTMMDLGITPAHPYADKGFKTIRLRPTDWYLDDRVRDALRRVRNLVGSEWFLDTPGANPKRQTHYSSGQVVDILDQLREDAKNADELGENLRKFGLTERVFDEAERRLLYPDQVKRFPLNEAKN